MPFQSLRINVKWAVVVLIVIVAIFAAAFTYFHAGKLHDKPNNDFDVYLSPEVFRRNYASMQRDLKLYIYPSDGYDNDYVFSVTTASAYAAEDEFFKNLLNSPFVTTDPEQARLFVLPFSFHTMRRKINSDEQVMALLGTYVEGLIEKYPYWNRTIGWNHVLYTCFGADITASRVIPSLAQNSIRLASISDNSAGFISKKDILIPSALRPYPEPSNLNATMNRDTIAYWMGLCNINTCNTLTELWGSYFVFDNNSKPTWDGRGQKLQSSKLCICPLESEDSNKLVTMAILSGCVPVILEDRIDLPFDDVLDWRKFSIIVTEVDAYRLKEILEAKTGVDYQILYTNVVKVQKHFYSLRDDGSTVDYDAFHLTMYELWLRYQSQRNIGVRQ